MHTRANRFILLGLLFVTVLACGPVSTENTPDDTKLPQPTLPLQNTPTQEPLPTITPETASTQPPGSAGLDHVNIYLVAMGDNGASGEYIGCGDSLVPVEITIEPTLGVLRAAINELLKLQGQFQYGQSGLYNALYLSELTLKDVAVINGKAVIELTGSLIFGGECDIPCIEEQLSALALQFSTVDSVSIFVNDEPLKKLLDLSG
ncbi:MAG: hypothetical protein Q7J07_01925 [Pelolinea sp.]|nr:hypothetical protein [Pelolinea sp.]